MAKEKYYELQYDNFCAISDYEEFTDRRYKLFKDQLKMDWSVLAFYLDYTFSKFPNNIKRRKLIINKLVGDFSVEEILNSLNEGNRAKYTQGLEYLYELTEAKGIIEWLEKDKNQLIDGFIKNIAIEGKEKELRAYLLGEVDKVEVNKILNKKKINAIKVDETWDVRDILYYQDFEEMKGICSYKKINILPKEIISRIAKLVIESKSKVFIYWLIGAYGNLHKVGDMPLIDVISELDLDLKNFFHCYINGRKEIYVDSKKEVNYIYEKGINLLEIGIKLKAKEKKSILEDLDIKDSRYDLRPLVDYLGEKNKGLLNLIYDRSKEISQGSREAIKDRIYAEVDEYTGHKEINAMELLIRIEDDMNKLKGLYKGLKESKSRDLVANASKLSPKEIYLDEEGQFDLDLYLDSVYKEEDIRLDLGKMELPNRVDGKDSLRAIMQLLISYKYSDEYAINTEALIIAEALEDKEISEFARQVYEAWKVEADYKTKWQVLLAIIHGDKGLMREIALMAETYAKMSRQKLGVYIVKVLGLNGSKDAFVAVDRIGRRSKFKTLRKASTEAFSITARELGISKDDLGDRIIGNMGFVGDNIPLDYGSEVLKLYIGGDNKFQIEKQDGKRVKSLPKGSKEDQEVIEEAKSKFKELKKELREMVKLQSIRLEEAFFKGRKWKGKDWKELFLVNPIMNSLGKNLVWVKYQGDKVVEGFAIDTEIFGVDYEEVEVADEDLISIMHPCELDEEQVEQWKEVFAESEIKFLFEQLDRPDIEFEKIDEYRIDLKKKKRIEGYRAHEKFKKSGWFVGQMKDGGSFDEFNIEWEEMNLGVEVAIDKYIYIGSYHTDSQDGVGLESIEFYTLDQEQYEIEKLPKRIVVEVVNKVSEIFN